MFETEVTGTVRKVETVPFRRSWQIRVGLPDEVTLVEISGEHGKVYRGFLFGEVRDIHIGNHLEGKLKQPWSGYSVVHTSLETKLLQPTFVLDPFGINYRQLVRYRVAP